jgi:hypothetical protein
MSKKHENPISIEELRSVLDYNPDFGEFKWKVKRRGKQSEQFGSFCTGGYLSTRINYKKYLLHRLAWAYVYGYFPEELDHINRNKTDNRICNLREATRSQNLANTSTRAKSGFKGVVKVKGGKFRAGITVNKKFKSLGLYATPQEAHDCYVAEAKKAFGEFSCSQ